MSSFMGHGLAGFCTYFLEKPPTSNLGKRCWLMWLIVIASLPDIDYIFPSLFIKENDFLFFPNLQLR